MTQEFHISVTPIGEDEYLVRTERVAPGVPLAEEQVTWPVDEWLTQAGALMNDPLLGLLRGDVHSLQETLNRQSDTSPDFDQSSAGLVSLGQQLYNALFRGTIRDSWMTAQGIAQHRQEVLRLRLGLKDARLPRLPWEVLHAGDRPLATRTDVVFSRYHSSLAALASPFQFQPAIAADQPLKILMVLAAPTDQEILALKQEALHLQEELQTVLNGASRDSRFSDIQLTILEQPGREQLTQALEHNHYQVLHYAGHSNLGADGGKVYLVSSKTGLTETLSGDDLAGLLVNNGIRMAVFNSCRGVYTATVESGDKGEGNLAEALLKRGIPAVLAMAERIPDDVALNLSRLFYRNLKQLYPVDLSLNRARQGLISSYSSNQQYWALPILYLHPEFDGYLQPINSIGLFAAQDALSGSVELEPAAAEAGAMLTTDDRNRSAAELANFDPDSALDPDDLEFDDLEYPTDLETVAQLVNQLSQHSSPDPSEDSLLAASPSESLLPEAEYEFKPEDYLILPETPTQPAPLPAESVSSMALASRTSVSAAMETDDIEVYSDLEQMLAESGKLTESISLCNQAVRSHPNNAEAHYRLGLALYHQGYLAEAIAAYQQTLRIDPTLAQVHNHLGLALYHQGKLTDAIRAYDQAIQLDPQLIDAQRNLESALNRQEHSVKSMPSALAIGPSSYQSGMGRTVSGGSNQPFDSLLLASSSSLAANDPRLRSTYARIKPTSVSKPVPKPLLWAGAGAIGLTTLVLGIWFFNNQFAHSSLTTLLPQPASTSIKDIKNPADLRQVSTNLVTSLASEQLSQGNLAAAQPSIEALLDRGALSQAAAVLTPALNQQAENPTMNFLMGRLAWQSVLSGNKDYSLDDARRFWETAAKKQPSPLHQNALGFAYYTEGNLERASRTWLQALQTSGQGATSATIGQANGASQETLTSYAGLALALMKSAETQPPSKRATLQSEAVKLRQRVLADDPANFQPEALAKNWMWSEKAIQDWRSLLALK